MGIELVWKAVLQWPVLLLGWLLGMHAIATTGARAFRRRAGVSRTTVLQRHPVSPRAFTPAAVAVVPVAIAMAVQESIAPFGAFTHFPAAVSYGALPMALLAGAVAALPIGCGTGRLGAFACAVTVPAVALALVRPPGLADGVPQLLAAVASCLGSLASTSTAAAPAHESATRRSTALPFASWWILFAIASGMVLLAGFAKLAVVLGALSATAAALAVAALAGCAPVLANGTAACLATAFVACTFVGQGYDEAGIPRAAWWLLSFAPAAAAVGRIPASRAHPRLAAAITAFLPAMLALIALGLALSTTGLPGSGATGRHDAYGLAAP